MKIENLEHSRKKVIFEISPEEFEKSLDVAFEKCNSKVKISGFRPGKAPRTIYEKNYGVESLYEEAIDVIFNNKLNEVRTNKDLAKEIIGQATPDFESKEKLERGKPFSVSLSFDVYPVVNLPQYKGIECSTANTIVTEEEVLNSIKNSMSSDASIQVKDVQVIEKGDIAIFDFTGSVDGVEFPGGKAENYELEIGSNQFIPGFEEQMFGMKSQEEKDIHVTFPENYAEKTLAGKAAIFKVKIHEVKTKVYPQLTDEYVLGKNINNVKTVEDWKKERHNELQKAKITSEKDRQIDEIINKILDNSVVDMPATLEEEKVAEIRNQYEQQAKMYKIPFETFLTYMGINQKKFEEDTEKQGKRQALFNVVITKIIEEEKLAPTKEDIEKKALEDANLYHSTQQEMLKKNASRYYSELAYNRVIDFLLSHAIQVDGSKEVKSTPKSSSTKKTTATASTTKKTSSVKKEVSSSTLKTTATKKTTTTKKASSSKKE